MDIIPVSIALAQAAKEAVGEHQDETQYLANGLGQVKVLNHYTKETRRP